MRPIVHEHLKSERIYGMLIACMYEVFPMSFIFFTCGVRESMRRLHAHFFYSCLLRVNGLKEI